MSGIEKLVTRIEDDGGPFFTIKQVSERLGRSKDTIRRWCEQNEDLHPTHKMPLGESGNSYVWLYTEDDIRRMEEYSSTIKIGRPPKKTEA